jgi:hypothetical protein
MAAASTPPLVSAVRVLIAAALSAVSVLMLAGMFVAETQSNYASWAISGGSLILAVAFSLIVFDGEEDSQTTL